MSKIKKIKNCPVCGSQKTTSLFSLRSIPMADNFSKNKAKTKFDKLLPINPIICNKCSHVFLKHFVNQNKYYKHNFSYKTQITKELKDHFNKEINKIIKENKIKKNSFCLDIGSNDGTILSVFKKNKMRFVGIEPSVAITKFANKQGLTTINGFFDEKIVKKISNKFERPKLIISTYTFANIENIKLFLKNIKNLISKSGIFVIETGYHPSQMKNNMFDYFYHEHFSYFTLKSLKYLLNSCGFTIIKAKITDTKSGSLLVVSKINSEFLKKTNSREKDILIAEKRMGVYKKAFYKKFLNRITSYKKKLHLRLSNLKKEGKQIAGYGASHSSTLLVHQFDLNKYLNFIVDDNEIKHYTFSPNFKIPVLPSKKIYTEKIKNVILLAWNKKKYIIKKHKRFTKNKGKFLLPF